MLDNALLQILIPIIQSGLTAQGYVNVPVLQLNQPTQQGVNTAPTVFLTKISTEHLGFNKNDSEWDSVGMQEIETDSQILIYKFQVSALAIQDPTVISYTASDLLTAVSLTLNSFPTVRTLAANNLGVLRIDPDLNPYFVDDKDRFEALPSFDFEITDVRSISQVTNTLSNIEGTLYPLEG